MKKKIILFTAILALSVVFFTHVNAAPYNLLQPIQNIQQSNNIVDYTNQIVPFIIMLAAVLAVVQIVIGGMEYALSESILAKEAGKDRIQMALLGLFIALLSYIILNTINPDLVNLKIPQIDTLNVAGSNSSQDSGSDNGPWTPNEQQIQLSTRPGGTVTCFTYNPSIDRRGTVTFGDSSKTIDQLMAQCQQQCVNATQSTGTQASCMASTNQSNTDPIILPSQARCTVTGQCSVTGTGAPCTDTSTCRVATPPPGKKTFCVITVSKGNPPSCTANDIKTEQSSCSQASCQVAPNLLRACPNATASCVTQ
ncbi:MAG: hypothetical protein UW30_C0004G0029 [Candidatus Giovannonibacteria bacterium GW2011_GWA2_44_13b]|uniref:Uncharacterized protein n=1 Tax=Candidatus Giovannonibacteria bacterium GW2011_GWA2_44_13b TaxID=1618647 RepID=A0A0G1H4X7_9BACT|nr:MAG: hypothetical protein UW30_C0004G0029 [Candidatus Giovannonibacteria bacterium GW2011_GWA2_44_13b]